MKHADDNERESLRRLAGLLTLVHEHAQPEDYLTACADEVAGVFEATASCACYWDDQAEVRLRSGAAPCRVDGVAPEEKNGCPLGRRTEETGTADADADERTLTAAITHTAGTTRGWLGVVVRPGKAHRESDDGSPHADDCRLTFAAEVVGNGIELLLAERRHQLGLTRAVHELEAPLGAVRNYAEILIRRGDEMSDAPRVRLLDNIKLCAETALASVGMLRSGRRQRFVDGSPGRRPERTMIYGGILKSVVGEQRGLARASGIQFIESWEDYQSIPPLYVSREAMKQLFTNLVVNAVKYRKPGAAECRLTFSFDRDSEGYTIGLKDQGIGIPRGAEERVFEEGFRARNAMEAVVTGLGLGLTIAYRVAAEHGGSLRVAHRAKPTVFELRLPRFLIQDEWWKDRVLAGESRENAR